MDCVSCGAKPISSNYCQECNQLSLDLDGRDSFALFQLPQQYDLDKGLLEERYLQLSRVTHPDLVREELRDDPRLTALSSFVNEAYRLLKDDFSRAEMLLKVQSDGLGIDPNALPAHFLMEMLDLQEEVEYFTEDAEKFEPELSRIEADMEIKTASAFKEVQRFFNLVSEDSPAFMEHLLGIQINLNTIRYYRRVLTSVEKALEEL